MRSVTVHVASTAARCAASGVPAGSYFWSQVSSRTCQHSPAAVTAVLLGRTAKYHAYCLTAMAPALSASMGYVEGHSQYRTFSTYARKGTTSTVPVATRNTRISGGGVNEVGHGGQGVQARTIPADPAPAAATTMAPSRTRSARRYIRADATDHTLPRITPQPSHPPHTRSGRDGTRTPGSTGPPTGPRRRQGSSWRRANRTFAGRSARRRMYHGYQCVPYEMSATTR